MKTTGKRSTLLLLLLLLAMIAGIALMIAFDPARASRERSDDALDRMTEWYLAGDLTRQVPEDVPDSGSGGALGSPWIAVRIPENSTAPEDWRVIDWNLAKVDEGALSQVKMVVFCRDRSEYPERVVTSGFYSTTVHDTKKIVDLLYCDAQSGEVLDVGSAVFFKQAEGYFDGPVYRFSFGTGTYIISDDTVREAIREKAPAGHAGRAFAWLFAGLYLCGTAGVIAAIVWKIVARRRRKRAQPEGTAL